MNKIPVKLNLKKLLHINQLKIFAGWKTKRFIIVLAGRRFGKSKIFAFFAVITCLLKRNAVVWFITPSYSVGEPSWKTTKHMVKATFPNQDAIIVRETDRTIEFPNGSMIYFKSGDRPDLLRGEGIDLAIIDEMEDLKLDQVWESALLPALMDKKGKAVMGGTPKVNPIFRKMYDEASKGKKDWAAFHFSSWDNPRLDPAEIEMVISNISQKAQQQEIDALFRKDEGNIYKTSYFTERMDILAAQQKKIATIISWDTASIARDDKNIAFSAGIVGWLLDDYRLFVRKVYQEKLQFVDLEHAVKKMAGEFITEQDMVDGKAVIIVEVKSTGKPLMDVLERTSEYRDILFGYNPKSSKDERAEVAAKWCEKGCVVLPYHTAPEAQEKGWLSAFEDQLYDLPNGLYRDMSDAFSQMCDYLANQFQTRLDVINSQKRRFN
jgi:phage terminase large subunit-like protein